MKKKILQVVHNLSIAGTEVLVAKLAREFQSRYETAVCCLDSKGVQAETLIQQGIPVYCLERRPGIDWRAMRNMRKICNSFQPDIIHAHQYTPYFYAALGKTKTAKLLFTEHGRHYPDRVKAIRRLANRWLERRTDWIGAVCEFSKQRLIEKEGFKRHAIEVIYNGVSLEGVDYGDREKTKRELGIPSSAIVVGFAGSLRAVKNPSLLLYSFGRAHAKYPDLHLLFVGDGELRSRLENDSRLKGLDRCVTFAGTRRPLYPFLKAMDLFVLPSLSEGASVTLLEAMAAGVPVLATDVGGNRELVETEVTGMLVPSGSGEGMAEKIARLKLNPQGLKEMAERAHEKVMSDFSEKRMFQKYGELYEKYS